jgi:hypothetical protein
MTNQENLQHYVLVGPQGKQAGRRDQKSLAIRLAAIEMTALGKGAGLASLLIPKTNSDFKKFLDLVAKGYWFKTVKRRTTIRRSVRFAAQSDKLLMPLIERFQADQGHKRRTRSAPMRSFAEWLCKKLLERDHEIIRLLRSVHPELPERTKVDWWKKQKNQGVKKLKK